MSQASGESRDLDGICGYCDERVSPATAVAHFADLHPGMEWSLLTWPDGTPALMDGGTDG